MKTCFSAWPVCFPKKSVTRICQRNRMKPRESAALIAFWRNTLLEKHFNKTIALKLLEWSYTGKIAPVSLGRIRYFATIEFLVGSVSLPKELHLMARAERRSDVAYRNNKRSRGRIDACMMIFFMYQWHTVGRKNLSMANPTFLALFVAGLRAGVIRLKEDSGEIEQVEMSGAEKYDMLLEFCCGQSCNDCPCSIIGAGDCKFSGVSEDVLDMYIATIRRFKNSTR